MHETMEIIERICKMKEKLMCATEAQFSGGLECVDTNEAGDVVDMIKDLAETEEKIWKACYYKTVIKAMHEQDDMDGEQPWYMDLFDMGKAGYDNYRYADGRFAPKGHGTYHRRGYMPDKKMFKDDMHWDAGRDWNEGRMGYDEQPQSQYGHSYDSYKDAKRHYTETHSSDDKKEMDKHAKDHVHGAMETMRDIWSEADPDLRQQMKQDLTKLVSDMK